MLTRGTKLGHYEILAPIGAGGMGEVYRARDERLERDVAVKVLPAGTLADEAARKRFRKEALALSKLNHPNIATIFDFDTQEGVDFLVMEHISGVTLADKLKAGPLPESQVLRVGAQVAEGLEAGHREGIIHRDIKPGNLRLTPDGRLKILDFGLAKAMRPAGEVAAATESLTRTQAVVGTLPYMAPEQLRGEPADARADLYAAGCVLYELSTGQRPFRETLATALSDAILHRPPVSPRALNERLSPELERITLKCLEKDPENRYQSARELAVDLRRLASPAAQPMAPSPQAPAWGRIGSRWRVPPGSARLVLGVGVGMAGLAIVVAVLVGLNVGGLRDRFFSTGAPGPIDSLAVLPLENLSRDPEQEYFADGMTEALTAELSKISALKVISRTSAMQYKGAKKPLPEIARELGVDGLIEGSVMREGDQVRITVQLIHGATDQHLWADSYQRELRGILTLQSEVARAIAAQIRVTLTPQEQARLAGARPVNPEAHEAFLKGRYHTNKRTLAEINKGIEYFQQAIEKDSSHAPAYAGLADSYNALNFMAVAAQPPKELSPRAKAFANRALELDEGLADAHAALALAALFYDWSWSDAEREFKRAIELNPGYAPAHQFYSQYLFYVRGRRVEALQEAKRAVELDPLSLPSNANLAWHFYMTRRYDEAIQQCQKVLELDPDFIYGHLFLAQAYEQKGMVEPAIAAYRRTVEVSGGRPGVLAQLARIYAVSGNTAEATRILQDLKQRARHEYVPPGPIAEIYWALGQKDEAFRWFERAYQDRGIFMVTLKVEPRLDSLRDDPRFQALLRRMNFPE